MVDSGFVHPARSPAISELSATLGHLSSSAAVPWDSNRAIGELETLIVLSWAMNALSWSSSSTSQDIPATLSCPDCPEMAWQGLETDENVEGPASFGREAKEDFLTSESATCGWEGAGGKSGSGSREAARGDGEGDTGFGVMMRRGGNGDSETRVGDLEPEGDNGLEASEEWSEDLRFAGRAEGTESLFFESFVVLIVFHGLVHLTANNLPRLLFCRGFGWIRFTFPGGTSGFSFPVFAVSSGHGPLQRFLRLRGYRPRIRNRPLLRPLKVSSRL